MAVEPLNRLTLRATSLADDLGFVALADLATALESDDEVPYRVIGGQMVMVLAARWGLGADLYRVTLTPISARHRLSSATRLSSNASSDSATDRSRATGSPNPSAT